jgi:hypothetical protein
MSLVELFDSITSNNLHGGINIIGGGLLGVFGEIFEKSLKTFGYIGGTGLWFFLLIVTLIIMGFTIYRVTKVCNLHILIKILLVLIILFVPIPFKTLIILGITFFIQQCKTVI